MSLTSSFEKQSGRNFVIFHPSDFSRTSGVAFAHALKIALASKAKLDIMHVEKHLSAGEPHWLDFPPVRITLARWGILPPGVRREEVAKTGVRIRKILRSGSDPVDTMLRHFRGFPPDLIVLATHQRQGLDLWLHKAVAEPLVRRSRAMTLFVPQRGRGFVSLSTGEVTLKKILIPVARHPHPQTAIDKASLLARGLGCVSVQFRLLHVGARGTAPVVDLRRHPDWSYDIVVRRGDIVGEILKTESDWRPDFIVLATQGRLDFLDALRGSTTERVLRGAHCPVLAIPVPKKLTRDRATPERRAGD